MYHASWEGLTVMPEEPLVVPGIVEFARDCLGFVPDATQERVLQAAGGSGILNCSRQWGKSTVAAAMVLYEAVTRPGSFSLVISPALRQSEELVRKAEAFAGRLGVRPKGDGIHDCSLEFPNGSRILGLPGTEGTSRG